MATDWKSRCATIRVIVTDVDGVLTDGAVGYGMGSEDEIKFFDIKDGTGFRLATFAGIRIAALTGRISKANRKRLSELQFDVIKERCLTKDQGLRDICRELSEKFPEDAPYLPEHCMYLGDDIIDLPAFALSGLAVAVADAVDDVLAQADWITRRNGGHGAAREAIDRLLREKNLYETALGNYHSIHRDRAGNQAQ